MNNSSTQAGLDEFGVKVQIKGKKFDGIILDKRARTLYLAIADLNESLLCASSQYLTVKVGFSSHIACRHEARSRQFA
jgi:hypothetical protein